MLKQKIADNWQWLMLWVALIVSALYTRPLIPIDETRYISVAWEMWHNNEFLVPHINGLPYSHKPPLLFWAIHLFWWLFGVGEWQARLVAPLFGLVSVILTRNLAKRLWPEDRKTTVLTPFILLGMLIWSLYSSLTMFDTLLTCCCLIILKLLVDAEQKQTILPWVWLSLALGMGLLAKGPVTLVYVGPPMLLAPWWSSRSGTFWRWWYSCVFASLVAGIAVALCWAIPAAIAGGEEYGQAILFSQTTGRMVRAFAHNRPVYWYLMLLPLLCFPWVFWSPVWRGWKRFFCTQSNRFCIAVLLPAIILLSCISGKQIHYVMPLLPFVALAVARVADGSSKSSRFGHILLVGIFLLIGVALFIVSQMTFKGGDRGVLQYVPEWLGLIPLGCALPLLFVRSSSFVRSAKTISTSFLLLFIALQLALAGPLHDFYQQTEIGERLHAAEEQSRQIAVFPANLSDQFQFAGHLTAPLLEKSSWDEIALWAHANPEQFCLIFTKSPTYQLLVADGFVRQYKDGWLIFRSAKDLYFSYRTWATQQSSVKE